MRKVPFLQHPFPRRRKPSRHRRRAEIIEESAFAPEIFKNVRDHFGKTIPEPDELRKYLEIKNFATGSISKVADIYRQNFDLVATFNKEYGANGKEANTEKDLFFERRQYQELEFDLTEDIKIVVKIKPSAEAFVKLSEFYEHNKSFLSPKVKNGKE